MSDHKWVVLGSADGLAPADLSFRSVESELFRFTSKEITPYEMPITDILTDNSLTEPNMNIQKMVYKKSDVLKALIKNRAAHSKIVTEAQRGFRQRAIELAEQLVKDLKAGKAVQLVLNLPLPDNHLNEFDEAIEMLKMSVGKMVELDIQQFRAYIRNQWHWQHQFLAQNARYSESASQMFSMSADD